MKLHIIKNINTSNCKKLIHMLYTNFIELKNHKHLFHTKDELTRLVLSKDTMVLYLMDNGKIISYLVGELKILDDGRQVFFINYVYTAKKFRGKGTASYLIEYVKKICTDNNLSGILLICDTENEKVHNFYLTRGFMPDLVLRRYDRHDVLYKKI